MDKSALRFDELSESLHCIHLISIGSQLRHQANAVTYARCTVYAERPSRSEDTGLSPANLGIPSLQYGHGVALLSSALKRPHPSQL